jgi:hypothetical protein
MSVDWNHEDGIDKSIKMKPKLNNKKSKTILFDYDSPLPPFTSVLDEISGEISIPGSSLAESEADEKVEGSLLFLGRKPLIESVTLKLFPMYYDEITVQPKVW